MTQVSLVAPDQILHVRHELASGTSGGATTLGDNVRPLNVVTRNTITGASLASNQITLPAGTYTVTANFVSWYPGSNRVRLVNVTDTSVVLLGLSGYSPTAFNSSALIGTFTLTATKALNFTHSIANAKTTDGLGVPVGDTFVEIYGQVYITKIA